MAFSSTFAPMAPGETRTFSVDLSAQLVAGDIIPFSGISSTLSTMYGVDPNAALCVIGSARVSGGVVSQNIGGNLPAGLKAGVTYTWTVTAKTTQSRTIVSISTISCASSTYLLWQAVLATEMGIPSSQDSNFQNNLFAIVNDAEQRCYRELDLLYATSRQTISCTSGDRMLSLSGLSPTVIIVEDLSVLVSIGAGGSFDAGFDASFSSGAAARKQLRPTSREYLDAVWNSAVGSAAPTDFAMLDNQTVILGPWPDQAYIIEVTGKIRPYPLYMSTGDTFLTAYLPDLFFAAAMVAACGYLKTYGAGSDDPRMAVSWEQTYQARKTSALSEEQRKKFHGFMSSAEAAPAQAGA